MKNIINRSSTDHQQIIMDPARPSCWCSTDTKHRLSHLFPLHYGNWPLEGHMIYAPSFPWQRSGDGPEKITEVDMNGYDIARYCMIMHDESNSCGWSLKRAWIYTAASFLLICRHAQLNVWSFFWFKLPHYEIVNNMILWHSNGEASSSTLNIAHLELIRTRKPHSLQTGLLVP